MKEKRRLYIIKRTKDIEKKAFDLGVSVIEYHNYYKRGLEVGFTKEQIEFLVESIKTYPRLEY